MDLGILAARNQRAQERMVAAAEVLAERFDLAGVAGLSVTGKDKAVVAMKQREAMADLLEALVEATEPKSGEHEFPCVVPDEDWRAGTVGELLWTEEGDHHHTVELPEPKPKKGRKTEG